MCDRQPKALKLFVEKKTHSEHFGDKRGGGEIEICEMLQAIDRRSQQQHNPNTNKSFLQLNEIVAFAHSAAVKQNQEFQEFPVLFLETHDFFLLSHETSQQSEIMKNCLFDT
jgi:hypothetical protein